jgi:hypothetical protein
MELTAATEHIAQYLAFVKSPGIEKSALRQVSTITETETGANVLTEVTTYFRIGLEVTQSVIFSVRVFDGVISVRTSHDWCSSWKGLWMKGRESCLEAARSMVREVLGEYNESEPAHLAALLLALSNKFGPDPRLLAMVTGRPEAEIELFGARFRAASIWRNGSVDSDPWRAPRGAVAFFLDALVGAGETERRWTVDEAKLRFRLE